jgi:DNA-binding CsgD family transcriptional regulator
MTSERPVPGVVGLTVIADDPQVRARLADALRPDVEAADSRAFGEVAEGPEAGRILLLAPNDREQFDRCADWATRAGGGVVVVALPADASDAAGAGVSDQSVVRRVYRSIRGGHAGAGLLDGERRRLASLTERELEILRLTARGLTVNEIAERLHRSINTVATHRRSLHRKLMLDDRVALTRFAIRHGVTSAD